MRRKRFLARLGGAGAPAAVAALLALAAAPTHAQPHFGLPVDCPMGAVCVVQNYMDDLPGPEAQDYRGGALTYEGHKGTDIRVPNLTYVERGVAVIAAAAGRVVGVRDGVPDANLRDIGAAAVAGIECGNGVLIDHSDGWTSQYCHMKRDSVEVRVGQAVDAGDRLGQIGMSGAAEFPTSTSRSARTKCPWTRSLDRARHTPVPLRASRCGATPRWPSLLTRPAGR